MLERSPFRGSCKQFLYEKHFSLLTYHSLLGKFLELIPIESEKQRSLEIRTQLLIAEDVEWDTELLETNQFSEPVRQVHNFETMVRIGEVSSLDMLRRISHFSTHVHSQSFIQDNWEAVKQLKKPAADPTFSSCCSTACKEVCTSSGDLAAGRLNFLLVDG